MNGQADNAPVEIDDIAQFLVDNPAADEADEEQDEVQSAADPETDNLDAEDPDASPDEGDESGEDEAPDDADQKSGRTFKVTIKGEDGADSTVEVDETELVRGYQRHADYTRKTQELSQREEQALEFHKTEIGKARSYFQEQAQTALQMVHQLAGLKSPQEMMALAQTDPAAYVQESARATQIQGLMSNIQHQIQQSSMQQQQQQREEQQKSFARCWGVLGQKGINKEKLQSIFETVHKDYEVPMERFQNLSDPALVLIMNDAVAYRQLQAKAKTAKEKVAAAPRLPSRQNVSTEDRKSQSIDRKFRPGGRPTLRDLAMLTG